MMDIFTGNGQFSQGELYMADQNVPAKLLLDLIYHMDSLREGLYSKVEVCARSPGGLCSGKLGEIKHNYSDRI